MKQELFIARKMLKGQKHGASFSRPVVNIAIAGIAIGLAVMLLSVAIVTGFKNEISKKVIGFGSHIRVINYDTNTSYETKPIGLHQSWFNQVRSIKGVRHIQPFVTKAGIFKTDYYLQGVVIKGVDKSFDFSFFENYMVEGSIPAICDTGKTNEILVSKYLADILKLKVGDKVSSYFIQDPPRMRKFVVSGIYDTQLQDLDKLFIIADARHIQKLNDWNEKQVTGFEILIDDLKNIDLISSEVKSVVSNIPDENGNFLKVSSIKDDYPEIFNWLGLLDMNVWVILILMVSVAGFNMVSGLLVIILERVNMIGILKSLGSTNVSIRRVFLIYAGMLIGRGMLWGNVLGIGLCLLQWAFKIVSLDPVSYYVSYVPININFLHIVLLNAGSFVITVLMMLVPSFLVTRVSPSEAIRFN
ncbi:MAG TPA: ABC transporter permease [Bacteroidales bacterium]|nr:ABC transporter permease [Bacteroidales bacterium]HQP03640.1 ABC transporter permease [Bacteroidales bacterium]